MFNCVICGFSSKLRSDLNRHLNTKKHKKNVDNYQAINQNVIIMNQNEPIMNQNEPTMNQNEPIMNQNEPTNFDVFEENENDLNCQFCNKLFNTVPSKRRHELHRCKYNPDLVSNKERREHMKEKNKLYNYIDKLLDNQGNTTTTNIHIDKQLNQSNTQTNTINLNSYGQEDLSHITDKMKMNLIKLPYDSVQKMIEQVHFNKKKPENKNIAITNKKEKMIKVYKDNKWSYKDRGEIIDDLIQMNYGRLDDYYENVACDKLSDMHNTRYKKYQHRIDTDEERLINTIKRDIEMIILSANL